MKKWYKITDNGEFGWFELTDVEVNRIKEILFEEGLEEHTRILEEDLPQNTESYRLVALPTDVFNALMEDKWDEKLVNSTVI